MNKFLKLFNSKNTVFSLNELKAIFGNKNIGTLKSKISYHLKKGNIERVVRGVYSLKGREINRFELVNKIYSPSYISFWTALYQYGIIFQYDSGVYLAYKKTEDKKLLDFEVKLHTLKKEILLNPSGIINNGQYSIASPERAFLDTVYLVGDIYFDHVEKLDYEKILELLPLYKSKKLKEKAKSYFIK